MILQNQLLTLQYEDDHKDEIQEIGDTKFSERYVSLEIGFLCFEIEWWCLGSAFYGGTEFRINKHWFSGYSRHLKTKWEKLMKRCTK